MRDRSILCVPVGGINDRHRNYRVRESHMHLNHNGSYRAVNSPSTIDNVGLFR